MMPPRTIILAAIALQPSLAGLRTGTVEPVQVLAAASPDKRQCTPVESAFKPVPSSGVAPNSSYVSEAAPPLRFRGDARTIIQFAPPDEVDRLCSGGRPVCGFRFSACRRGNQLIMPNPCGPAMAEPFAKLLCHELAHVNGWPATHGD